MDNDGLRTALARPGAALLVGDGSWRDGARGLLFADPLSISTITAPDGVRDFIDDIEQQQRSGHRVLGYLCYEAGAAFGLPTHKPWERVPLGWMAAYAPESVLELDPGCLRPASRAPDMASVQVRLDVTKDHYTGAIAAIKELIASGDTYQVNYTCRAGFRYGGDVLDYFLAMVRSHPAPYAAYINLGESQILSMSPELFLQRRGRTLLSKPMKGTRPRGRTTAEDEELVEDLTSALKDRAENLMIVDMVRNDLGRVAMIGSVEVPRLFTAEKYRTVWQMTTDVTATVADGAALSDIFAATFPGASITGAPKHRTMEIIKELEPQQRGVYCGALGLFEPGGDFTLNLPIRTLVHTDGDYHLGIGAGIVWDSDPDAEYDETLLKSHFALRVLPELSLWETLLLDADGRYVLLEEHLARMGASAEYFGIRFSTAGARHGLEQFARETDGACVVRMELSQDGEITLVPREVPVAPERPVRVLVSSEQVSADDRLLYHKTSLRELYKRARDAATDQGYFEVIFTNTDGHVTEGSITNLFVRSGQQWMTPPIADGLLPGTWRGHYIGQVGAVERSLRVEDIVQADEVVIGNSVRGAVIVDGIDVAET